jgi:hypothetical protein
MTTMSAFSNREAWRLAVVQLLKPIFEAKKHIVPDDCQVSCGFASTGMRSHHMGQCWSRRSCSNERNQIFISPVLGDPVHVLEKFLTFSPPLCPQRKTEMEQIGPWQD